MVDLVPQSVEAQLEVARSMAVKYFGEVSDQTARGHVILALMDDLGLFEFNANPSTAYTWNAKYKLPTTSVYGPNGNYAFASVVTQIQYTDVEGGVKAEDSWDGWDAETNTGPNAIRNVMADKTVDLETALNRTFSESFFLDGTDANNAGKLKGISTFLKFAAPAAGDKIAVPNGTYAGVSCVLGSNGGGWENKLGAANQFNASLSNDWPRNKGQNEYDFNSSLGVVEDSSSWLDGSAWNTNCEELMRFVLNNFQNRVGARRDTSTPIIFLMGETKYNEFVRYFTNRNRQPVPVPEAIELGFPETFYFEGAWVQMGYEIPANEVYIICPDMIEFKTPRGSLIKPEGPQWSMELQKFLYLATIRGLYHFNPKYTAKIATGALLSA